MTREEDYIRRGDMLIELLGLKTNKDGRINTRWGTKTPLGLFLTVQRIINDDIETIKGLERGQS